MLTLPIKKKWFDMIKDCIKKEEYREIKPYYDSRFRGHLYNDPFRIKFRNGYSSTSPEIECIVKLSTGTGREDWGAEIGTMYYVLEIKKVLA